MLGFPSFPAALQCLVLKPGHCKVANGVLGGAHQQEINEILWNRQKGKLTDQAQIPPNLSFCIPAEYFQGGKVSELISFPSFLYSLAQLRKAQPTKQTSGQLISPKRFHTH